MAGKVIHKQAKVSFQDPVHSTNKCMVDIDDEDPFYSDGSADSDDFELDEPADGMDGNADEASRAKAKLGL